ncbi:MAG: F0F1 ATP synthase subunit epsilon [Alphaproteobacteria bacterium]|jgi:F-type H+-transporting ATPase subunit epsilon
MADKLQFDLVSPEQLLLSEDVDMVTLPGSEGDFGVLPGHAPVLSTLKSGVVEVKGVEDALSRLFVRGGFAEVNGDKVTVLAQEAIVLAELNVEELDKNIKNTEEDLVAAKSDEDRERVSESLAHLKQLRAAV